MHSLELINYEALNNETNLGAKSDIYRYEASFYLPSNFITPMKDTINLKHCKICDQRLEEKKSSPNQFIYSPPKKFCNRGLQFFFSCEDSSTSHSRFNNFNQNDQNGKIFVPITMRLQLSFQGKRIFSSFGLCVKVTAHNMSLP